MSVCLLLIGDGRHDYRERTLRSAAVCLPPLDACAEVDDTAHDLGFAGAIQAGWDAIAEARADYVFHLEADFTFNDTVPLAAMIAALDANPTLAQVALKRQPWNAEERAAGGICELHPGDFTDEGPVSRHRRFFTTNPSVYRASLCECGWPQEPHSEGVFTHRLLADGFDFAFWGGRFDPPAVTHIGAERTGRGY